ncbi:hypothetical protein BG842_03980 [Haladaptatus sp. W1]|nr:hypothetical protein BG842_03980 [Haladaptatus sp. W1]
MIGTLPGLEQEESEQGDEGMVTIACLPVDDFTLFFGLDLQYDQQWILKETSLGDLSSVLSLAPAETLTLVIKKTLRTKLEENTLKSTESMESFENSIVDKEVMNVTRTSARSKQWGVTGTGSISYDDVVGANVTGSFSKSIENRHQSTREKLSETTQKSARQLKNLQKTEVGRTTESVFQAEERRVITNPYRDRSLTLNVYDIMKTFDVATQPLPPRPVAVLDITNFVMDNAFVKENGDFLATHLLDQGLAAELELALEDVTNPVNFQAQERAGEIAATAFEYLFDHANIFDFTEPDANSVDKSFSVKLSGGWGDSGLKKASDKELGEEFAAMNLLYEQYRSIKETADTELTADEKQDLIGLAIALESYVADRFEEVPERKIKKIFNEKRETEPLRRLPGFLTIVNGQLKPLLKPVEEEREAIEAVGRAEFVINRIVKHLNCHRSFYINAYLLYLWNLTGTSDFTETVRRVLVVALSSDPESPTPAEEEKISNLERLLDFGEGFINGTQFVVPLRTEEVSNPLSRVDRIVGGLTGPDQSLDFDIDLEGDDPYEVDVPADGVYIEAVDNLCHLPDVPEEGSASVEIDVEGRDSRSGKI